VHGNRLSFPLLLGAKKGHCMLLLLFASLLTISSVTEFSLSSDRGEYVGGAPRYG
jgi:hypothetical protein